jgi:hypothetical protein
VSSESGTCADSDVCSIIFTGNEVLYISGSAGTSSVTGNPSVITVFIAVLYLGDRSWDFHVQLAFGVNVL